MSDTKKQWATYNSFINKITFDTLDETTNKFFPQFEHKLTTAPKFHESVQLMFKTKTTERRGLKVLKTLFPFYRHLYENIKTLRQRLSEVRKVIKKHQSPKFYENSKKDIYFNINMDERTDLGNAYRKNIKDKNNDRLQLDINKIYQQMKELALSENIYDRIIALMLSLGTRAVELFDMNDFSPIEGKESWVRVDNLAKKKDGQQTWTERPVVLFTVGWVINEVKKIRDEFKNKVVINKKGKLASDKQATLNKRVLHLFPWTKKFRQKSSFFRKMYADMAFTNFGDPKTQNKNQFISSILGHDDANISSSFSYSWVGLSDPKKMDNNQMKNQISELRTMVQLLTIKVEAKTSTEVLVETKLPRTTSKKDKLALLEKLYNENPSITNSRMRGISAIGSALVNDFLKTKRNKSKVIRP